MTVPLQLASPNESMFHGPLVLHKKVTVPVQIVSAMNWSLTTNILSLFLWSRHKKVPVGLEILTSIPGPLVPLKESLMINDMSIGTYHCK